jgi:hypothetical protein
MLFIAFFHVIIGGALMTSIECQSFLAGLYGAQIRWSDEIVYLIRILGSFAFTLGVLAALAALDPIRNRVIGWGFVILFVMRNIHRHLFHSELERGFLLNPTVNLLTTMFFLSQAVLLAWLLVRLEKICADCVGDMNSSRSVNS